MEKAHETADELRENTTPETLDGFRERLNVLTDHLSQLQTVLNNQEALALDELADMLSQEFTRTPSDDRRTPRMKV